MISSDCSTAFPFEQIESDPALRGYALQLASDFLGEAMDWVVQGGKARREGVVVRALTLAYMTNPSLFGNQAELAATLGVSRKVVCTSAGEFRELFGYSLTSMRGKEVREKYSQIKTEYHASHPKQTTETVETSATEPNEGCPASPVGGAEQADSSVV